MGKQYLPLRLAIYFPSQSNYCLKKFKKARIIISGRTDVASTGCCDAFEDHLIPDILKILKKIIAFGQKMLECKFEGRVAGGNEKRLEVVQS